MNERVFIRINGIGHAFSRELGCECGRCRTVNFTMTAPPRSLATFAGWDDPPWRAHTSASILIPDEAGNVKHHILIDVGAGVVDSLVCSGLKGLDHIDALLITHWHPDHVLALNQLCESVRRTTKDKGRSFEKIPLYCHLDTYDHLRDKGGQSYVLHKHLCFHEILPEKAFNIDIGFPVKFTPLAIAHGEFKGTVIFVAEIGSKKVIFGWDIDVPNKNLSSKEETNMEVINRNLSVLQNAKIKIMFMSANTWAADETKGKKTGHTSYLQARDHYLKTIAAHEVFLVHMSGHEDGRGNPGYGWTDSEWEKAVKSDKVKVARQGMVIEI